MNITKTQQLANITGVPYIRLTGTPFTTVETDGYLTAKQTDVENELLANWFALDLTEEKAMVGESSTTESKKMSDDGVYAILEELKGGGTLLTTHKIHANYIDDTFHNQRCDIAYYNSKSKRCAVIYDVVFTVNVRMATQASASIPFSYTEVGDHETIKDTWTLLELVTVDNLPIIETVQVEDDGVGTLGLVAKINSLGTTAGGAVGTISACGWCMLKQADGTLPLPILTDGATASTRTATGYLYDAAITAAAGRWQVRAWATNAAGTSYGKIFSVTTA